MSQENISNLLPNGTRKFRETTNDSNIYHLEGHTAAMPKTLTITRILPTPRKGNPGTLKILLNVRHAAVLDQGKPTERVVPVITKVETSVPVGLTYNFELKEVFKDLSLLLATPIGPSEAHEDLFIKGMLPNKDPSQENVPPGPV